MSYALSEGCMEKAAGEEEKESIPGISIQAGMFSFPTRR